jgi:predicted house-cleaning noncanonical NTP pyrophosphatase (MazG superfamily)
MPETRYIEEYKDGKLLKQIPYEVSDEELAEEQEKDAMDKAADMINAISSLADAKVFLKKLCRRLFKSGALP